MTSAMDLVGSTLIANVLDVKNDCKCLRCDSHKRTGINMLRELQIGKGKPKAAWLRL